MDVSKSKLCFLILMLNLISAQMPQALPGRRALREVEDVQSWFELSTSGLSIWQ